MSGYDYKELNKGIVRVVFKKSIFDSLSIDECLQLLGRGHNLELA